MIKLVSACNLCSKGYPKGSKRYPKSSTKSEPPQQKNVDSVREVFSFLETQLAGVGVSPPTANSVANCRPGLEFEHLIVRLLLTFAPHLTPSGDQKLLQ